MDIKSNSNLSRGISVIKTQVELLESRPGIYKMLSCEGKALYIGKAKNLPKRVISYSQIKNLPNRLQRMVAQIFQIEVVYTNTEAEALLLEASLIKSYKPIFNILLRDDRSFPYILIEETHLYPRITKFRGQIDSKKGSYYGPFASVSQVNETIAELQKIFQVRPCSDNYFASRTRPCLQHQIKRCSAPCVNKVTPEEYAQQVKQMKKFLEGKSTEVQEQLIAQMHLASNKFDYEKAALIRDRIKNLTQVQAKNIFSEIGLGDVDIFAIYSDDSGYCAIQVFFLRAGKSYGSRAYFYNQDTSKEEVLETFLGQFYQRNVPPADIMLNIELRSANVLEEALRSLHQKKVRLSTPNTKKTKSLIEFVTENSKSALAQYKKEKLKNNHGLALLSKLVGLAEIAARVEVYDNSHTGGEKPVGCMVVATSEGLDKASYRKFNIKSGNKGDDYSMLEEVLTRRLNRLSIENYPNILIIDGGKGHLSIAIKVFKQLNISDIKVLSIAKGPNRNAGHETLFTENKKSIVLPKDSPLLLYLRMLRDEVHNFAIRSHRNVREKVFSASHLDSIPGIGRIRKRALLNLFGSVEEIRKASLADLEKITGINKKIAKKIFDYLHNDLKS
jgi:excinuclease ABC subunit C